MRTKDKGQRIKDSISSTFSPKGELDRAAIVGITGGIGSGKSYVAAALQAEGYPVYDCDNEAKRLIQQAPHVQQQIIALFGKEAYITPEQSVATSPLIYNRQYIASVVFEHPHMLQQLNAIVHPAVYRDIQAWHSRQTARYAFVESAILFESGLEGLFDTIICITAPLEQRIARAMGRNRSTREQVEARIRQQMSEKERMERSQLVVINDGDRPLEEIVNTIITYLNDYAGESSATRY